MTARTSLAALGLVLAAACALPGGAQDVLPRPEQPFGGFISLKAEDSTKDFPKEVAPPPGAPNVLLILTDDVGFGASSALTGGSWSAT